MQRTKNASLEKPAAVAKSNAPVSVGSGERGTNEPRLRLALPWRILLSIVLALHIVAVFAAPFSGPGPASEIGRGLVEPFGPYLDAAYLGHGYRFFAPQPGPSHLVRYTLTMPDGAVQTAEFPNLPTQQPRLLYHRHFMLSEKFNGLLEDLSGVIKPSDIPPQATPEERANWQRAFNTFQAVANSYAQHLLASTGAKSVKLALVRHNLPTPDDVRRHKKLDDPKSYEVLWTETFGSPATLGSAGP